MRGYFSMSESVDVDIDIDMDDIIENLDNFFDSDIEELYEECKARLDKQSRKDDSTFSIEPTNLYDEQKMVHIKTIFEKMTLNELKELTERLK